MKANDWNVQKRLEQLELSDSIKSDQIKELEKQSAASRLQAATNTLMIVGLHSLISHQFPNKLKKETNSLLDYCYLIMNPRSK